MSKFLSAMSSHKMGRGGLSCQYSPGVTCLKKSCETNYLIRQERIDSGGKPI